MKVKVKVCRVREKTAAQGNPLDLGLTFETGRFRGVAVLQVPQGARGEDDGSNTAWLSPGLESSYVASFRPLFSSASFSFQLDRFADNVAAQAEKTRPWASKSFKMSGIASVMRHDIEDWCPRAAFASIARGSNENIQILSYAQ